ncbi:hypothetical protein TNCV_4431531 [Trichonephila clavipes]|nr:hypothetical protein TNCV_4431531 [Trichonephila clavipes]
MVTDDLSEYLNCQLLTRAAVFSSQMSTSKTLVIIIQLELSADVSKSVSETLFLPSWPALELNPIQSLWDAVDQAAGFSTFQCEGTENTQLDIVSNFSNHLPTSHRGHAENNPWSVKCTYVNVERPLALRVSNESV